MSNESTSSHLPQTYFAAAGRDTTDDFARKVAIVRNSTLLTAALDALPGMVMILNQHRQIVAVNRAMVRVLEMASDDLLEKRLGEVIGCVRPREGPDGCGTSRHCVTCGAVNAILESQSQQTQVIRECRVITEQPSGGGALDLRVAATPMEVDGERFILVAVDDMSQPNRMAVLQRVFFHDVLNTAGCILERHCLDRPAAAVADPGKHAQERFGGHACRWQRRHRLSRSRGKRDICRRQPGCHA